jgi:hypothetical protein
MKKNLLLLLFLGVGLNVFGMDFVQSLQYRYNIKSLNNVEELKKASDEAYNISRGIGINLFANPENEEIINQKNLISADMKILSQLIDQALQSQALQSQALKAQELKAQEFLQYVQKNIKGKYYLDRDDLEYSFLYSKSDLDIRYERLKREYESMRREGQRFFSNYFNNFGGAENDYYFSQAKLKLKSKEDVLEKIKKSKKVIDEDQVVVSDDQKILRNILEDLLITYNKEHNERVKIYWEFKQNIENQLVDCTNKLEKIKEDSGAQRLDLAKNIYLLTQQKQSLKKEKNSLRKLNDRGSFYRSLISSMDKAAESKIRNDFKHLYLLKYDPTEDLKCHDDYIKKEDSAVKILGQNEETLKLQNLIRKNIYYDPIRE